MCPVCQMRAAEVGVLCIECRDELSIPIRATPEQIQHFGKAPTPAALIDVWGRPHPLDPTTLVGRSVDGDGLAVLESSISRHHARVSLEGSTWFARDLGSSNGTYIADRPIEGPTILRDGACLRFGQIAFYFLQRGAQLPAPAKTDTSTALIPKIVAGGSGQIPVDRVTAAPPGERFEEEHTDPGLPSIALKLHEPTGGGGGLVELEGKQVQLTTTQFELVTLMISRMASDANQPPLVRGFVRSSELIAGLSWDTRDPSENHVKQLVRRVRRALMKVSRGDLIESRHRFGYRLRAIPRGE